MPFQVDPTVLVMKGGEVDATVNVKYPTKYFNKKAIVTLTPVLKYEGGEKQLDPLVLQGEDAAANNKSISFDGGGSATQASSFPYEDAFVVSELHYDIVASIKDKQTPMGTVKLADGVIHTSRYIRHNELVGFAPHGYELETISTQEAEIFFQVNRANLNMNLPLNKDANNTGSRDNIISDREQ